MALPAFVWDTISPAAGNPGDTKGIVTFILSAKEGHPELDIAMLQRVAGRFRESLNNF